MRAFFVSFAFLLNSCGAPPKPKPAFVPETNPHTSLDYSHVKIDPALKPAFVNFLAQCEIFPKSKKLCEANLRELRSVVYADKFFKENKTEDTEVIGRCTVWSDHRRYMEIKKGFSDPNSFTSNFLMVHEAAHCLLDQGHAPENSVRVMAPNLLSEEQYKDNYTTLVDEVFKVSFPNAARFKFYSPGIEVTIYDMYKDGSEKIRKQ